MNLLYQVEVAVANGKRTNQAWRDAEIVKQGYYRWRRYYGGMNVDQARRLKELEQENAKLKRLLVCADTEIKSVWRKHFIEDYAVGECLLEAWMAAASSAY